MKRKEIPSFGDWDYYTGIPFSGECSPKDVDLFNVPKPPFLHDHHHKPMMKTVAQKKKKNEERRKQHRTAKAVDEDLYKIPPELLYKKPNKKGVVCDKLKRYLRLSCIS